MKLKNKFYVIENFRVKIIILTVILFTLIVFFSIYRSYENIKFSETVSTINTKNISILNDSIVNLIGEEEIEDARETINLKEYTNMKKEIDGYKVVGKIEIPKINVEKYILEKTNENSLKKSVTKICGPTINKTGNFCIAGHNYYNTFGRIGSLEKGDVIKLTDTFNRVIEYKVYMTEKVDPKDVKCLSQDTQGEREITLVTCTLGAIKRIVIKAVEIYD